MTVNVRKRQARRKHPRDTDHAKRKRIKKAVRTAGSALIPGFGDTAGALEKALKKSKYGKARKPRGRAKVRKKPKSNSLYGDWLDSPSKAAKKSRKKFIGVDERDV